MLYVLEQKALLCRGQAGIILNLKQLKKQPKPTAQDGTYEGRQSGYAVTFNAPDVNTGKLTAYNHTSALGYRGLNIIVHVTVNRGIVTKSSLQIIN